MREFLVDTRQEASNGQAHSFDYYVLVDQMEVAGGIA